MTRRSATPTRPTTTGQDRDSLRGILTSSRDSLTRAALSPETRHRDLPPVCMSLRDTVRALRDLDAGHDVPTADLDATRDALVNVRDHVRDLLESGRLPARESAALARRVMQLTKEVDACDDDHAERVARAARAARARRTPKRPTPSPGASFLTRI